MSAGNLGARALLIVAWLGLAVACGKEEPGTAPGPLQADADIATERQDAAAPPLADAHAGIDQVTSGSPDAETTPPVPPTPPAPPSPPDPPPPEVDAGSAPPTQADAAGEVAPPSPPPAPPTPPPAPPPPDSRVVFALDRLHEVRIEVDAAHLATLNAGDPEIRVPAVVTYDGVVLPGSGIRKKGYSGSKRDLWDKTGFTVDFHEFAPRQRLHGLKKLTLNNSVQDGSFLHEHLFYELYRRMGQPAPLTAHGLVTFNGMPFGLYVIKESIDGEFLDRSFGKANDQGNLYEGPCCHDFVTSPEKIELKDEVDEMRSRQDLLQLAELIRTASDAEFEAVVGARLDLESFLVSYAIDAIGDHFDDYVWNGNNYYLYNHPGTGKFVFVPHGADQALWSLRDPLRAPEGLLARRVRQIPALDARFRAALKRVMNEAYVLPALNARIDQAAATVLAAPAPDAKTAADFQSMRDNIPMLKHFLTRRQTWAANQP